MILKTFNLNIMQLITSQRRQAKMKLALQGASGTGKTYSSLLLAFGMINDWSKIAVIDSENGSSNLYAHLGAFKVLSLPQPFTPETYIEAITICENAGIELIIIDSLSQSWEYLLEYHAGLQGNSFTNWSKITPKYNTLIQKMLNSDCHILATFRTKQDYVLNEKNNRIIPEKVGLKAIMRDGIDYEFTIVFDIDIKHNVKASKDRTELFSDKPEFVINADTGKRILEWCNSGVNVEMVRKQILESNTIEELSSIYHKYPEWYQELTSDFINRKTAILEDIKNKNSLQTQTNFLIYGSNGVNASHQ